MEKLSKLLNEYLESKKKDIKQFMNIAALMTQSDSKLYQTYIISKDFDFIKRLVENDKINYLQLIEDNTWNILKENGGDNKSALLMLLAIQDEPIKFLISILK